MSKMRSSSLKRVIGTPLGWFYQMAVGEKHIKQSKLVMTLLVRDEVDIIESNIEFHLNQGVDLIIATDNGSIDGTTEILNKYERQGCLHLIHERSRVFDQRAWVNRMGRIAHLEYRADLIFHCDADEFWYPRSGSLKRELLARPWVDVLTVNFVNVLMRSRNCAEVFPEDAVYAVTNPLRRKYRERVQDADKDSFLLFRYPKKVIYKLKKGYLDVSAGNHAIVKNGDSPKLCSGRSYDIDIFHFPVRGFEQFARKANNGGEAREMFKKQQGDTVGSASWQFMRWLDLSRSGKLTEEYNRLNLSNVKAKEALDAGLIRSNDERHLALLEFLSKPNHAENTQTRISDTQAD